MRTKGFLVACLLMAAALPALAQSPPGSPGAPDPSAAGGPTDEASRASRTVTMYGHVFGNGLDTPQPANTFAPVGDELFAQWQEDDCGIPDPTGAVAPGGADCDKDGINKLVLFLTAGPVQVHSTNDFNDSKTFYSKLHNEHGRAKDVFLDTSKDIHAWFYAAADYFSWTVLCNDGGAGLPVYPPDVTCPWPEWGWDPGIMPNFVVEAKLYMAQLGDYGQGASEAPPIGKSINVAKVIAQGSVGPVNMQTGLPGSPNAQEFDINLGKPTVDVVPKDQDLFLVYSWYENVNGQKFGFSTFPSMKPWSSEQFPTRFALPIKNPVDVELVIPQFLHSKALIASVVSSPWGSYDVDTKQVTLDLRDGSNQPVPMDHMTRSGDYSVAHGAHFKPVNITWVWDYQADHARPGTYKATVSGCDVEAFCSSTEATFTINPDGTPGDYTIGRSGQLTASQSQIQQITQNGGST